jgi:hypothetical protein
MTRVQVIKHISLKNSASYRQAILGFYFPSQDNENIHEGEWMLKDQVH